MAVDYFAHSVYGVVIEDDSLLNEVLKEIWEDEENEDLIFDEMIDEVISDPRVYVWLKAQGFPDKAMVWNTGNEDDYPGRCATPPETWIVGWGKLSFPQCIVDIPEEFKKRAEWHSWVTAG